MLACKGYELFYWESDSKADVDFAVMKEGRRFSLSKDKIMGLKEKVVKALKNFSTGMMARLGFAVATSVRPDVLIVDEILGVGDFRFQKKCEERIQTMIGRGVTVLLVSHSIGKIKEMCSRAVLLRKGEVVCIGDVGEVCGVYEGSV